MDKMQLSLEESRRYGRHLILDEVGIEGQLKLKAAKVVVIGAGGLGSPAALYLAAAGVGTLGLVDFDVVDASNLHRQILHKSSRVGSSKLESARDTLEEINPNVKVVLHQARLNDGNAMEILKNYDVVVDGTDNFPTRFLVNDACVLLGKPNVYGSIFKFEGQASVFDSRRGPCYRCLYPEPPPEGLVPNCAEAGVLGVLPGIVGCIQANEAIKIILGTGRTLMGRLLYFDALAMSFTEMALAKNPACPVCGSNPIIKKLLSIQETCTPMKNDIPQIDPLELQQKLKAGEKFLLLDVRNPNEYKIANIKGMLIPLGQLGERMDELDDWKEMEIVVHCHHGGRSQKACELLNQHGFKKLSNLTGGIEAWSQKIDKNIPRY